MSVAFFSTCFVSDLALNTCKNLSITKLKDTLERIFAIKQNSRNIHYSVLFHWTVLLDLWACISVSQRQKSESQDESWSSVTDSQQGTVFVGTVTVAWEGLKKYKHMSCFILVPLPLQWNEVKLEAFSQTSSIAPSLLSVPDFLLPMSDSFMFTSVCRSVQCRRSENMWIPVYGGHPVCGLYVPCRGI